MPQQDEYDGEGEEEDEEEDEFVDAANYKPTRSQVASPIAEQRAEDEETDFGRVAVTFQIRKRIRRERGMEKVEDVEDAEPPGREYIEREWKPVYGGGVYAIYKDSRIVQKVPIEGDPIYIEDIERKKRQQRQEFGDDAGETGAPTMLGFVMTQMRKQETELAAAREENRRLADEARKAELSGIKEQIRALQEKGDDVDVFLKKMSSYEKLVDRFRPKGGDTLDRVLDNPMFQRMADKMIEKLDKVDFSNPDLFPKGGRPVPPGQAPAQPPGPRVFTKPDYVAKIQEHTLRNRMNIPAPIIERSVDIAFMKPSEKPDENLLNSMNVLDKLLDARRALYHLKENVLEGTSTDDDAALFIIDKMPKYAEYLQENGYDQMMEFLAQFDDIPQMKDTVRYARTTEVKEATERIIANVRRKLSEEPGAEVPDLPGLEESEEQV
jgi:hypothetical protein